MAALTLPRIAGESEDAFAKRVVADSLTTRDGAADFGTAFHAGAERVAQTLEVDRADLLSPWLNGYRHWYQANALGLRWTPLAILLALGIAALLYLLVALAAVLALPADELARTEAPFALLYTRATGQAPTAISIISLFAVVNGALIQIIVASRVLYGMCREGWLHVALEGAPGATHAAAGDGARHAQRAGAGVVAAVGHARQGHQLYYTRGIQPHQPGAAVHQAP